VCDVDNQRTKPTDAKELAVYVTTYLMTPFDLEHYRGCK